MGLLSTYMNPPKDPPAGDISGVLPYLSGLNPYEAAALLAIARHEGGTDPRSWYRIVGQTGDEEYSTPYQSSIGSHVYRHRVPYYADPEKYGRNGVLTGHPFTLEPWRGKAPYDPRSRTVTTAAGPWQFVLSTWLSDAFREEGIPLEFTPEAQVQAASYSFRNRLGQENYKRLLLGDTSVLSSRGVREGLGQEWQALEQDYDRFLQEFNDYIPVTQKGYSPELYRQRGSTSMGDFETMARMSEVVNDPFRPGYAPRGPRIPNAKERQTLLSAALMAEPQPKTKLDRVMDTIRRYGMSEKSRQTGVYIPDVDFTPEYHHKIEMEKERSHKRTVLTPMPVSKLTH